LAEYAPGVEPAPWRFPARNRIIAGLCAATVVVEARERSGALITADLALEEGREVLAVPGEILSALSRGTNDLLRLGATPLTGTGDVLELFGLEQTRAEAVELSPSADTVLVHLRDGPASADELARTTGLDAGALASALTELELAGVAVASGGVFRAGRSSGVAPPHGGYS
jgi:DNA processing protein